jgi:hypothetical protein
MGVCLVIHGARDGTPEVATSVREIIQEAVWQVADTHWPAAPDVLLVASDLSPDYLADHFDRALARHGLRAAALLLVTRLDRQAARWRGLPPEGEAWLRTGLA